MGPKKVIVGLGELLWDLFPDGARFGGAPTNFACSAAGLGSERCDVYLASAVGIDPLGEEALAALVQRNVSTSHVARNHRPTGQVHVRLDGQGHASYEFEPDAAWDRLEWNAGWEQLAKRTDAVCFGTLGQRSPDSLVAIRRFVAATPATALRILDINVRMPFISDEAILGSLKLANVLKLNDQELPVLEPLFGLTGNPVAMLRQLVDRFGLRAVAFTRGSEGAILIRGEEVSEEQAVATAVVDTVGAGDAFTAALAIGLLHGGDLQAINRKCCEVAAYVCSQSGATPEMPSRFR